MKKIQVVVLPLILFCQLSFAQQTIDDNRHAVMIGLGMGENEITGTEISADDWDMGVVEQLGYRFQWDRDWALDTRYIRGSSSGLKQIVSIGLLDGEVNFDNLILSGQGRYGFSQHGYLYGNLGAAWYDWEATSDNSKQDKDSSNSDNGVGLFLAMGIKAEWQKWEVGFEYQRITMGDLISNNGMVSLAYKF